MSLELNKIYCGDCLELMKDIPDGSIDCVVTSPPYWGLRDYGTATWVGGDPNCNHVRDNKVTESCSTGHKNMKTLGVGDSIYKEVCQKCGAIRVDEQIGLEVTFNEYINNLCNIFDEIKRVLKKEGTCWVNLGDTYNCNKSGNNDKKESESMKSTQVNLKKLKQKSIKNKCLLQIPSRFSIEMIDRGWILRNEIIWYKPNCMPAGVKDRFTVDFEKVFFFVKSRKYYFEQQFEEYKIDSIKKATRRHHSAKSVEAIQKGYNGISAINLKKHKQKLLNGKYEGRNKRTVWEIATKSFHEAHFATYPEKLIEPMIKAGCPVNGIVLDPFMGAGTTGLVSTKLNRNYIGIELNPEYIEMANKRIEKWHNDKELRLAI